MTYGGAIGYICMSLSGSECKHHGKTHLPTQPTLKDRKRYNSMAASLAEIPQSERLQQI